MTKTEYNSLISMINSTDEDFELAKNIINNKYNDSILIKLLILNCPKLLVEYHEHGNITVEHLYKAIMYAPDKYKYFYLFEYCVEKRIHELLNLSGYNSFIEKISITLLDG